MTIYTYDKWVETFKPIPNHLRNQEHGLELPYETYGEEYEYVLQQDPHFVWTEVDGDNGSYIIAGLHFVNRFQYYITNRPWTEEDVEVPTWMYRACDCQDDEKYEDEGYNPDCPDCDEGSIDVDCDTVESLRQVYGPKAEIIG